MKRIPTRINLPFGYRVSILQLPKTDYNAECGDDSLACWIVGHGGGTIYLNTSRSVRKRRADLAHELLHACADFQTWLISSPSKADVKEE
jgi:Zn-dependent peptidase ImmA (M78 family)